MKRNLPLLLILALASLINYNASAQQILPCNTDEATREALKNNPDAIQRREQLEEFTKEYTKQQAAKGTASKVQGTVYVIPVVFHILHQWGSENISDDQVYDQVRILNRDYRKLNPDTVLVVPDFANNIADVEFEFRLAHIDPNGNCTNGIVRYYDPRTNWDRTAANNGGNNNYTHTWNPRKYLNIYVVKTIIAPGSGGGVVVAYTYLPGTWSAGDSKDAIVITNSFVGSIGTSNPAQSYPLSHEIGHWFNLNHTWTNINGPLGVACGDDDVFDTPETQGTFTCNLAQSICNPPIIENVQNFMDYAGCNLMFTEGQKTRMHAAITSSTSLRNNLWTVTNLAATGTDGASPTSCLPIPYLNNALRPICEGASTSFTQISMNLDTAPTPTFLWGFPGGTPSTSTLTNPSVTYSTAGHYDVSLTITNAAGSNTVTYPNMVSVYLPLASALAPYSEGFETITFPGTNYDVDNMSGNTWTQTTTAAATGTNSIYINNWGGNFGTDVFVTPSYDFTNVTSVAMSFKLAFAKRNANADDRLQVFGSTNCGSSWVQRYNKVATGTGTSGLATTTTLYNFNSFVPNAAAWRTEAVVPMGSYANQPNVRFKFVYTYSTNGNYGNNLYIDDINISGTVGINELFADQIGMSLSPNPTDKTSNLTFTLTKPGNVVINVLDVTGRTCSTLKANHLQAGEQNFEIGNDLSAGVYFVELINNNNKALRKLVVE